MELVISKGERKGTKLDYNNDTGKITVNGVDSKDWEPAYIPSGEDEPDFFGFINLKDKKLYDIHGNISNLSNESEITI